MPMPGLWAGCKDCGFPSDSLYVGSTLLGWFAYWNLLVFCMGLMPFSYIYRGGAVRFSFYLGALAFFICTLRGFLWGIALLEINS